MSVTNHLSTASPLDEAVKQFAADLAAEFRLFNTGPRTVTTEQASKITKKEKAPAAKKAIARAKIDEQMD